jgi:hypothetical protein
MMAELVNGPITVRTGLEEAAAAPSSLRVPRSRRSSDAETRARVARLRRDGWSYRRIAATLELRYAVVAEILDGPAIWVGDYDAPVEAAPAIPAPRRAAAPAGEPPVEAAPFAQARLADQVDALLRAAEQQRAALTRLETTVLGAIRTENARLGDRILTGIKALFERLLPVARRDIRPEGE